MILTPAIEQQIVDTIREDPASPVILPDHCYGMGDRVVVLVDGLPIDLHRHLYNLIIRPLGFHEHMLRMPGVPYRNVNPHLFLVPPTRKSTRTHCREGHAYEGNEAPPNTYRYRCATCFRAFLDRRRGDDVGTANADKTACPYGHDYDEENTIHSSDGRRRCRRCRRALNRRYMAKKRKEQRS
jgi:hypothetical protein